MANIETKMRVNEDSEMSVAYANQECRVLASVVCLPERGRCYSHVTNKVQTEAAANV